LKTRSRLPGLGASNRLSQPRPPLCRPCRLSSPRCPSRNGRGRGGQQRQPTAQTPELGALSPIADNVTPDYAAILDCGNLKDVEALKELVRKSVAPALRYVNTKILVERLCAVHLLTYFTNGEYKLN
jgi:hypothetical protein